MQRALWITAPNISYYCMLFTNKSWNVMGRFLNSWQCISPAETFQYEGLYDATDNSDLLLAWGHTGSWAGTRWVSWSSCPNVHHPQTDPWCRLLQQEHNHTFHNFHTMVHNKSLLHGDKSLNFVNSLHQQRESFTCIPVPASLLKTCFFRGCQKNYLTNRTVVSMETHLRGMRLHVCHSQGLTQALTVA